MVILGKKKYNELIDRLNKFEERVKRLEAEKEYLKRNATSANVLKLWLNGEDPENGRKPVQS